MREATLLRDIRLALGRIQGCDFQRLSQGRMRKNGRTFRVGLTPGAPDLIGCVLGRYVALEVKTTTGKVTAKQARWHKRMRRVGAIVEVVRSVTDAVTVVRAVIDNERAMGAS